MLIPFFKINIFNKCKEYLHSFLHLFYPHLCLECGTDLLSSDSVLCIGCENKLPFTDLFSIENNIVEKIFWGRSAISAAGASLFFTKDSIVQILIFELKYKQNKKAGWLLGRIIGSSIKDVERFEKIDWLIPIPLSTKKERQRGFNQALIICEGIQQILPALKIASSLKKKKATNSQTKKGRLQRSEHVDQLFELHHAHVLKGANLLIVDDVITTGATLEAAHKCLWQGQPNSISIAAAAYTL